MWFKEISKDSDVVISTRIRFARSVEGYKFPNMMQTSEKEELIKKIKENIDKKEYDFFKTESIDKTTLGSLVEEHLISKEFTKLKNTAIILNKDSSLVAMVNEEDHLRMQAFKSGFEIDECYRVLKNFNDNLEKKIEFIINDKYGYITSCPTNVGAAMRVSVMLHLPALARLGLLAKIIDEATRMGLSVRGLYGENTSGYGNIYQISNSQTLGISNENIIRRTKAIVKTIIFQERKARDVLKDNGVVLYDEIYRALGILQNSRIISEDEAFKLLSKVRLGVSMEIIENIALEKIQSLMIDIQSNTLKTILKKDYSREELDIKRAKYIREELK